MRAATVAVALLVIVTHPLRAQHDSSTATNASTQKTQNAVISMYTVPDIPAVTFLNGSNANISRPTTPKSFLMALANGVNADGRATQGFGLEVSPLSLLTLHITPHDYQRRGLAYFATNLQLSAASLAAPGDTSSTDLSYGVRETLFDDADPRADSVYMGKLGQAIGTCFPENVPPNVPRDPHNPNAVAAPAAGPDTTTTAVLSCMDKKSDSLAKDFAKKHWNGTQIVLAYAGGYRLVDSRFSRTERLGDKIWVVGSKGFGQSFQLIGYGDITSQQHLDTIPGYFAFSYGARANLGSESVSGFVELLGQTRTNPPKGLNRSTSAWSAGLEFRAASSIWLSAGFGKRFQQINKPDRAVLIANIRWGLSSKPAFDVTSQ